MRWDFPDPSDVDEARRREPITAAMDRWWQAFVANKQRVDDAFTGKDRAFDVAGFTDAGLEPVAEGLCWEYGPAIKKKGHRLVITPEGEHELRPLVRELLRRSPELPDWEFYPGRLPEKPEVAFQVAEQIAKFRAKDVQVQVAMGQHRRVELTFHVGNAKGNEQAATHWIFRAAEQMLGEEILDHWLGVIELAPPPSKVRRLFGSGRPAGLVSPERLKPTIDALISASRDQLPDPPPRVIAQKNYNDNRLTWCTLTREPQMGLDDYPCRDDMFVIATCEEELAKAQANDALFHSARFSRTGETFAYLKLDRRGDEARVIAAIDSADARGAIEEAVNAALGEHGLGCTTGGGTGVMYAYVDVALTDVKRAIPVLRELLQRRRRVHQRSWLLFFEPELAEEWVGVYPETPPPPARPNEP